MALPSGYKRLEYIQSSGTQYIDTGFKPNQNTRVAMAHYLPSHENTYEALFGARSGGSSQFWAFWDINGPYFRARFNTQNISIQTNPTGLDKCDFNRNVLTINGISSQATYAEFTSPFNIFLFGVNNSGNFSYPISIKLYSCQIYDNDILIRDFIPCQTTDGEVGLWDDVNSVFYANSGTGTFTAGPIVIVIPDPPSNLHQTMAVRLAWAAVSGAERYNVYRDGTLLATTTDLAYVDDTAAENTEYTYGVSAVNSAGESPKTTMTVYTKTGYFLYKPVVESANFQ